MTLRLEPAHRDRWIRDVFGNSIALVDWLEPADHLTIVNDVIVERLAPFPDARPARAVARAVSACATTRWSRRSPASISRPSFLDETARRPGWLRDALAPDRRRCGGTMLALCGLVTAAVRYQRRAEKGVQSPAQTLALGNRFVPRHGDADDGGGAALGVAARFASGYLHGTASLAGHASTHAWTEVYLPTLGWRGFDPTIGDDISSITSSPASAPTREE